MALTRKNKMPTAFLLICLSIMPLLSADQTALQVLSAYQAPQGTLNVIFQNSHNEPIRLDLIEIGAQDEKLPIPFWWAKPQENPIPPERKTCLTISMTRPLNEGKELTLKLRINNNPNLLTQKIQNRTPLLKYAVQDASSGKIYAYLVNQSPIPLTISEFKIHGQILKSGNAETPHTLLPNLGTMMTAQETQLRIPQSGYLPTIAEYKLSEETQWEPAYLFSSQQFLLGMEEKNTVTLECPTHSQGQWMGVGEKIFNASKNAAQTLPTVHFCRNRLSQGLAAFAQTTPRIKINPQASNLKRGKKDAISGYVDVLNMANTYTQPGIHTALIENTSIFHGSFGSIRNPQDAPLSQTELLSVSLAALAYGAKGLEFRIENADGEEYARRVQYLLIRFELLRPFLSIAEVLPLGAKCSSEKVTLATMLCGDKGMMIFVLGNDVLDNNPLPPFEITFSAPEGIMLENYAEITTGEDRGTLANTTQNTYSFTLNNLKNAALYFCPAKT